MDLFLISWRATCGYYFRLVFILCCRHCLSPVATVTPHHQSLKPRRHHAEEFITRRMLRAICESSISIGKRIKQSVWRIRLRWQVGSRRFKAGIRIKSPANRSHKFNRRALFQAAIIILIVTRKYILAWMPPLASFGDWSMAKTKMVPRCSQNCKGVSISETIRSTEISFCSIQWRSQAQSIMIP